MIIPLIQYLLNGSKMNRESIRQIAKKKLVDLQDIDGLNIIRGIHEVTGIQVAIYYIDYSETTVQADQLQTYQEKLISTDYYNNSGLLQWNFYLIFVRELVDLEVKRVIEQNDILLARDFLQPLISEATARATPFINRFEGLRMQQVFISALNTVF